MHLKMPSGKWRPACLGLNELTAPTAPRISNSLHSSRYTMTDQRAALEYLVQLKTMRAWPLNPL